MDIKIHVQKGLMLIWVMALSASIGIVCVIMIRLSINVTLMSINRVKAQQDQRVVHIMYRFIGWYLKEGCYTSLCNSKLLLVPNELFPFGYSGNCEIIDEKTIICAILKVSRNTIIFDSKIYYDKKDLC